VTASDLVEEARTATRRFDAWFDHALDHIRGNPVADKLFYGASAVGDWGLLWHVIGATRALLDPRQRAAAVRLSTTLAVESLLVNQGVKRLLPRHRPVFEGVRPHGLRTPLTTSFPSGHASAAFCAAALLSDGSPATAPLWYGLATIVAVSRPYVRIHHASDMVAGAAVGYTIGRVVRKFWRV
jgi:undecaprenyl-diphosphatase